MNEVQSKVRAVLMLSSNESVDPAFHPLRLKVYGLTLLERTLRALERAPVSKVTIVAGNDASETESLVKKTVPWNIAVEISEKKTLEEALKVMPMNETVLAVREPMVINPASLRQMIEQKAPAATPDGLLSFATFQTAIQPQRGKPSSHLTIQPQRGKPFSHLTIHNREELRAAKKALRRSLIKPTDGWVSKNLNRPISISISRVLAHTAITPNQFSIFTGLLGILTGVLLAQGAYWGFMLGAALFHITSVLDGVDGELARLKFKASPFGQWLDTLVDNSSYVLALGGFLTGLFRDGISDFEKIAGISTLVLTALALGSMYYYLKKFSKGGSLLNIEYGFQEGKTGFDRFMLAAAAFGRRDLFALIFFLLGLFGLLHLALIYISVLTAALLGFSVQAHLKAGRGDASS